MVNQKHKLADVIVKPKQYQVYQDFVVAELIEPLVKINEGPPN